MMMLFGSLCNLYKKLVRNEATNAWTTWPFSEQHCHVQEVDRGRCPAQLRKQYGSTNSPHPRGSNSDMGAKQYGLESHDLKVFGTVN